MTSSFLVSLSKNALQHWFAIISHLTVLPKNSLPTRAQLHALIEPHTGWRNYLSHLVVGSSQTEDVDRLTLLVEAVMGNPLCHLAVDHVKKLKEGQIGIAPAFAFSHKSIKSLSLLEKSELDSSIKLGEVGALTFAALLSGVHRYGMALRFQALQTTLLEHFLEHFLKKHEDKDNYVSLLELRDAAAVALEKTHLALRSDLKAALFAVATGFLKASTVNEKLYSSALTSAVWKSVFTKEEITCLMNLLAKNLISSPTSHLFNEVLVFSRKNMLLNKLLEKSLGRVFKASQVNGWNPLITAIQKVKCSIEEKFYKNKQHSVEHLTYALELSEQMNPLDFLCILLATPILYDEKYCVEQVSFKLLATPLTVVNAYVIQAFLRELAKQYGGKRVPLNSSCQVLLSSGSDIQVVKSAIVALIDHSLRERPSARLVYLASGSTLHTLTASLYLMKDSSLRQKALILSWPFLSCK